MCDPAVERAWVLGASDKPLCCKKQGHYLSPGERGCTQRYCAAAGVRFVRGFCVGITVLLAVTPVDILNVSLSFGTV